MRNDFIPLPGRHDRPGPYALHPRTSAGALNLGKGEGAFGHLLNSDIPSWIAIAIVIIVAAYFTLPQIHYTITNWNTVQTPSWEPVVGGIPGRRTPPAIDIDTMFIHGGVVAAPALRDTLRWWHGTWAGQVVFYRPISSYAFWIDWKIFGNHEIRYTMLSILLHLLAVWQFARLSCALFQYFRIPKPGMATLLSGLFFVDGIFALSVRQATNKAVFEHWKNMPESLMTLFFCCSLTAYLQYITHDESEDLKTGLNETRARTFMRSAAPVIWYLASCSSKEAGILLPLLLIPLEFSQLRRDSAHRRRAILRMTPMLAALPLFVVMRRLFLGMTTGFTYGSNGSWVGRMTDNLLGAAGHDIRTGRPVPLLMGVSLAATICLLTSALRKTGSERSSRLVRAATVAAVLPVLLSMFVNIDVSVGMRPAVFIMQTIYTISGAEILGIAIMLVCLINVFRGTPIVGLFGYTWVVATVALLAFTPSSIHREYLVEGGFAIMLAAGLTLWGQHNSLLRCRKCKHFSV